METAFNLLSYAPGPFWLLIFLWPTKRKAMLAVDVFIYLLAAHFAFRTLPEISRLFPIIVKPTLEGIRAFLATPEGTLGAWNHMILADLWIGRWVAQDSAKDRHAWALRLAFVTPILFFGPFGLFFYMAYRWLVRRQFALSSADQA
jgi:hypothetical protein